VVTQQFKPTHIFVFRTVSEESKIRPKGVSVVICCHNSASRLKITLDRVLNQQTTGGLQWEIIVVNNNSSDNTHLLANDILATAGQQIPFQVVDEPEPGLSSARKKGYDTSKYEYLLLVDDDNWLVPSYIQIVHDLFEEMPDTGIVGGWGEPVFESPAPSWFDDFSSCYALGEQGAVPENKTYTETNLIYGAGMAMRMSAYDMLHASGYRSILSDRKGNSLISGGDTELCLAMNLSPYKLIYDNRLKFKHQMPDGRINWHYLKKLTYGFGRSTVKTQIYDHYILGHPLPELNLRLPLWLDRMLNLAKEFPTYWKLALFGGIISKEGDKNILDYLGWKGRLAELFDLKAQYEADHRQIAKLAESLNGKNIVSK
jgi:glycosyltransferase involved in cell wall biosynthesis